jgi:hypothetical protein
MDMKCLRKIIVMMMKSIILVVLAMQANDLTLRSLHASSLPFGHLRPPEPLAGYGEKTLYDCLETRLEHCMAKYRYGSLTFAEHITHNFFQCLYNHRKETDAEIYHLGKKCVEECLPKLNIAPDVHAGTCLYDCFDENIRKN